MVVPPHLPERYCPVLHLTFVQVVQLPFFVVDEPARYWLPVLHEGWLAHWVSAVPAQLLVLYLPAAQPEHALHEKPLAVPPQVPVRYLGWRAGSKQVELIHGAGWGTTCLCVVLAARASSTTLGRHPARRRAAHTYPHGIGGWRG